MQPWELLEGLDRLPQPQLLTSSMFLGRLVSTDMRMVYYTFVHDALLYSALP